MDRMQKRLDAMEKLRREIDDREEELLTAKRRWKNSSETLHQLTEEKQRKVYRLSQFEEIMKKQGLKGKCLTNVGGAPVTQQWADEIGADVYSENAQDCAAKMVKAVKG